VEITLKKLLYYRDVKLFLDIIITSLKIFFTSSLKRINAPFYLSPFGKPSSISNSEIDKVTRYVALYTFIRSKLGFRETCFTYSTLLCNVLRRRGVDAHVNFGARKKTNQKLDDIPLAGHCWVTVKDEEMQTGYLKIFQYP